MKNLILLSIIGCFLSGCFKPSDGQKGKDGDGLKTSQDPLEMLSEIKNADCNEDDFLALRPYLENVYGPAMENKADPNFESMLNSAKAIEAECLKSFDDRNNEILLAQRSAFNEALDKLKAALPKSNLDDASAKFERIREAGRIARQSSEEALKASEGSIHGAEGLAQLLSAAEKAVTTGKAAANEGIAGIKERSEKAALAAYEHAANDAKALTNLIKESVEKIGADATKTYTAKIEEMDKELGISNAIIDAMKPLNGKEGDLYKTSKGLLAEANKIAGETSDLVWKKKQDFAKKGGIATKAYDKAANFSLEAGNLQNLAREIKESKSTAYQAQDAVFKAIISLSEAQDLIDKAKSAGANVDEEVKILDAGKAKLIKAKADIGSALKEKVKADTEAFKSKFDEGDIMNDLNEFVNKQTAGKDKNKFDKLIEKVNNEYKNYGSSGFAKSKEKDIEQEIKEAEIAERYASTPEGTAEIEKCQLLRMNLKKAMEDVDKALASVIENNPNKIKDARGASLSVIKGLDNNFYSFRRSHWSSDLDTNDLEKSLKTHGVEDPSGLLKKTLELEHEKMARKKEYDEMVTKAIKTPGFLAWYQMDGGNTYLQSGYGSLSKSKAKLAKLNKNKADYEQAWKELETNLEEVVVKDAGLSE
jgi:hypothetical protein